MPTDEELLRQCYELLEKFEYVDDEDSSSYAFFKARLNSDTFFILKNSIERQLAAGTKK